MNTAVIRTMPGVSRRMALRLMLGGTALVLGGCAAFGPPPVAVQRPARRAILRYGFDGGLTLRQDDKAWRITISWQHDPAGDRILLSGPLGQGIAEITRDRSGARLNDAKGKTWSAPDADTLLRDVVGIPAPLDALPRWLLADIDSATRDAQGRPLHAEEGGWRIDYPDYESDLPEALPQRLELQRDGLTVNLRIDQWQLD